MAVAAVHTHQQNRIQSSPVRLTKNAAVILYLAHNGRRGCAYTPAESNPVQSSPVQSSQTHKDAAVTLCLAHNGRRGSAYTPAESNPVQSSQTHKDAAVSLCLAHTGSRGSAYTPAESNPVQSHESCRVKSLDATCLIFVSQAPVIGRDGRNGCR